jgi:Endonuclease domain
VKLFLKLPSWFKIATPLGGYNPDWAIVREESEGHYLYLVRETKGGSDIEKLRFENEKLKIKFGQAHFTSIKVDYAFGDSVQGSARAMAPSGRFSHVGRWALGCQGQVELIGETPPACAALRWSPSS